MFSKRLREVRIERGYTQEQIAKYLGFTRPTYTAYESGRRKPDNDTLAKIAKILNVSTDYLLGRTNIKDPIETITANHEGKNWLEIDKKEYLDKIKDLSPERLKELDELIDLLKYKDMMKKEKEETEKNKAQ